MKKLATLAVVLVEQHKTAKWLAEQMEKDPTTISKWCTNKAQPSLETIKKIAEEDNVAKIVYFYLKGVDMYSFNIGAAVPSVTVNILSGMKLLIPNEEVINLRRLHLNTLLEYNPSNPNSASSPKLVTACSQS